MLLSVEHGAAWRFEAFCKAGSRMWGKKLVASFEPLPQRASYVEKKTTCFLTGVERFSAMSTTFFSTNIEPIAEGVSR